MQQCVLAVVRLSAAMCISSRCTLRKPLAKPCSSSLVVHVANVSIINCDCAPGARGAGAIRASTAWGCAIAATVSIGAVVA